MYTLGTKGINDKDYDILCKDLVTPVKGGKFQFQFWFRNVFGQEAQNNAFKIRGIAYEIDGTAHELTELGAGRLERRRRQWLETAGTATAPICRQTRPSTV